MILGSTSRNYGFNDVSVRSIILHSNLGSTSYPVGHPTSRHMTCSMSRRTDDIMMLIPLPGAHEVFPNNRLGLVMCFHQCAMSHVKTNTKSISLVEVHRFM
ncbi:SBP (S-ribonuclease binding protein) family protein [Striga asiatica]|uniref:SBP (S-ribonuclease binding protein) family protein n=1 Tax=Striga asiatica TaxID=4170 RepID=A0A5A7PGU8_STRAF|nr:SBP (S-ribonuclease binding protein) family protein [Striga asiatica]